MEEPLNIVVVQKSQSNVHIISRPRLIPHLVHVHFIANLIHQDFPPEAPTHWLTELLDILPQDLIFEETKWNKGGGREGPVVEDNVNGVVDRFPPP